jgi:translocation and assembly module TamB
VDTPASWPPEDVIPEFKFDISGEAVPVARQTGVMIRSDLNLEFAHQSGSPPRVSGTVNLQDSFFLADLDILQFTQVSTPEQRPPYFSVDIEPLSGFELDVRVTGDEFMQIRTPVFKGIASANLDIGGTLEEPAAFGDIRITSGTITFPFSNLYVQQGVITLSQANPYDPQLLVTATGRSYGFDIQASVSGTANQPVLTLTSAPPLSSEEILLMITAGTIPRDDFEHSSEQKASKLAFFLGKNLLQKFGADEATEEKLIIRSAEGVSDTGKVTYFVEYLLGPKWSLIAEYDEYNAVNAGLKYKLIHR